MGVLLWHKKQEWAASLAFVESQMPALQGTHPGQIFGNPKVSTVVDIGLNNPSGHWLMGSFVTAHPNESASDSVKSRGARRSALPERRDFCLPTLLDRRSRPQDEMHDQGDHSEYQQ
jgi:hypothetical protein